MKRPVAFAAVRRVTPLALLALIPLAACGDDDDGGESTGFASMLDDVPAEAVEVDGTPMLQFVDMGLVWERLEVADDASDEERLDALGAAREEWGLVVTPIIFAARSIGEAPREELGFDILAVEREIAVDHPPSQLRILDVSVDADEIVDATEADPIWGDRRQTVESDHGEYFDWTGEEGELAPESGRTTPMRPLGIGGQLAVEASGDGARVVRTHESATMEAALARAAGEGESANDDGPFAGAADVFDGDVVQLIGIGGRVSGLPTNLSPEQIETFEERAVFIEPYESILAADVVAEGDARFEVVLLHDDAEDAAANEEPVKELLAEGVTLQNIPVAELLPDATVEVDGTALRITTDAESFGRVYEAVVRQELFLTR